MISILTNMFDSNDTSTLNTVLRTLIFNLIITSFFFKNIFILYLLKATKTARVVQSGSDSPRMHMRNVGCSNSSREILTSLKQELTTQLLNARQQV